MKFCDAVLSYIWCCGSLLVLVLWFFIRWCETFRCCGILPMMLERFVICCGSDVCPILEVRLSFKGAGVALQFAEVTRSCVVQLE